MEFFDGIDAVSFDVFDTLLGRRWTAPKDVFEALGRRLGLPDAREFRTVRADAELALRRQQNFRREVTLRDIAVETAARLSRPDITVEQLCAHELDIERASSFGVPAMIEAVRQARSRGLAIAFTSDTYLPETFIAELLTAAGAYRPGDVLCVSSTCGVMKSTGELFAVLLARLGLEAGRVQHVGDNEESDLQRARAMGLKAVHITPTETNRFELPQDDATLTQAALRGVIRAARLQSPAGLDDRSRQVWDISTAVAAPLVSYFLRWCADQARERGITRLYCLARDGQILHRVAATTSAESVRALDVRYLKVSRQALLLPALNLDSPEQELDWILAQTHLLTPRIALRRVAVAPAEIESALTRVGFTRGTWDRHLSGRRLERFRTLFVDTAVIERVTARVKESRETAIRFLQQEGLFDDVEYAVIDAGWNGTLQRSIGRLLALAGSTRSTVGFYVGLRGRRRAREDDTLVGCLADVGASTEFDSLGYAVPMVELFLAADHGGVMGYRQSGSAIEAVLNAASEERLLKWGVPVQQQAIEAFERQLALAAPLWEPHEWKRLVMEHLRMLLCEPTHAEARLYGEYQDAEDQTESYSRALAAPFGIRDALRYRWLGQLRHHNEWAAGSLALSPGWCRVIAGAATAAAPARGSTVMLTGVIPVVGVGPEEGPYRDLSLPRFVWGYGPRTTLQLPRIESASTVRLELSTLFPDQSVAIEIDGDEVCGIDVPPGRPDGGHPSRVITLPVSPGSARRMVLKPSYWSPGDRPLAIIITHVSVCSVA